MTLVAQVGLTLINSTPTFQNIQLCSERLLCIYAPCQPGQQPLTASAVIGAVIDAVYLSFPHFVFNSCTLLSPVSVSDSFSQSSAQSSMEHRGPAQHTQQPHTHQLLSVHPSTPGPRCSGSAQGRRNSLPAPAPPHPTSRRLAPPPARRRRRRHKCAAVEDKVSEREIDCTHDCAGREGLLAGLAWCINT